MLFVGVRWLLFVGVAVVVAADDVAVVVVGGSDGARKAVGDLKDGMARPARKTMQARCDAAAVAAAESEDMVGGCRGCPWAYPWAAYGIPLVGDSLKGLRGNCYFGWC